MPTTTTGQALRGEIAATVDERTNALIVAGYCVVALSCTWHSPAGFAVASNVRVAAPSGFANGESSLGSDS